MYSRNISKKYSYDIGTIIGKDKDEFQEFFSFLWKGKRSSYALIKKENKENTELDAMESMNKNMMIMMPVMSVIISFIAPLGLALYWLVNNVLMILERVVITKILDKKEEANENA